MSSATESQLRVIGYIEDNLGVVFRGNTKSEARSFISENIEESKRHVSRVAYTNTRIEATNMREAMDAILPGHGISYSDAYDDDDFRPW